MTSPIVVSKRTYQTHRNVFSLPDDYSLRTHRSRSSTGVRKNEEVTKLIKYIDDNIVGKNSTFQGPFGRRKVVFCDYVASGRSLQFIEDYIIREVLPSHGNTHASTNITSLQSSLFREEARDIIRHSVNASDDDFVIFAGHGSTGVIHKLLSVLGFVNGETEPPIVFAGSCDHHTNLLPWREIGAQIVKINETREGHLDLNDLENQLQMHYHDGKTLIGCFSAVSNITGIETDTIATTLMLHQYGALSIWDYATAAPYTPIDMNPEFPEINHPTVLKDAIFFSGHKLLGGVQTPGVLIAKKALFRSRIPNYGLHMDLHHHSPTNEQELNQSTELREEGATAAVVESIRAALAVQLKENVGTSVILARAERISKNMLAHLRTIPEILLLGSGCHIQKRLPIFSFMVRHPRGTFLHHNFVCAVLNDVFGIQARGGCACAGPFAQDLLGIDGQLATEYEEIFCCDRNDTNDIRHTPKHSHREILRPGFTRVSLPYCMSEAEVTFVMEAIKMVATEGWKLLPQYTVGPETDEWRHHTNMLCKDRKWLASIRYTDGKMVTNERRVSGPGTFPQNHSDCLQTARNIFNRARKMAQKQPVSEHSLVFDDKTEKLRWFMLPSEAQDLLLGNSQNVKHDVPFHPISYLGSRHSFTELSTPRKSGQTPYGSPRHYSLPVMEDKLHSPRSVKSVDAVIHPNVHFAVGESVTSPTIARKIESFSRNRCYSLGSETPSIPLHSSTQYVSQNDLNEYGPDLCPLSPPNSITQTSSGSGSDCSIIGKECLISLNRHSSENLQAYLKEVTKELATEIKSEIRGVISTVEDVLESTDSVDMNSLPFMQFERNNSSSDESRGDSVSANDVAEYLMGVSKEMASEVKSEIREMVNSVDMQLDKPQRLLSTSSSIEGNDINYPPTSSTGAIPKYGKYSLASTIRNTDVTDCLSTVRCSNMLNKSYSSSKLSEDDTMSLDLGTKTYANSSTNTWSTINSVSSQDSGINLSFQEPDPTNNEPVKQRSSSESSTCRQNRLRKQNGVLSSPRPLYLQKPSYSDIQESWDLDLVPMELDKLKIQSPDKKTWSTPPKNIWKPFIEVVQEFNLFQEGDSVLVCMSGGPSSISLLHSILQYQYYAKNKGVKFTLGAITLCNSATSFDTLTDYVKELEIPFICDTKYSQTDLTTDELKNTNKEFEFKSTATQEYLYSIAKNKNYNVLAFGNNLDDLAEEIVTSVFRENKLNGSLVKEEISDLCIIRPLIYVREEALRQFVDSRNIPTLTIKIEPETKIRQLLNKQEMAHPNLFSNLKIAFHPLMQLKLPSEEYSDDTISSSSQN